MPFEWLFIHTEKQYARLSYLVKPSDATDKGLKWSSSDPSIATVDSNGLVKGVKGGTSDEPCTVTITATAQDGSGKKATCKVTVLAPSEIWFATAKTQIQNISPGQGISVKGIVKSNHKLKSITVSIFEIDPNNGEETLYLNSKPTVNSNSFDLNDIDKEITFSELPKGSYKFVVEATDIYGYNKTLQSEAFDVSKFRFTKNAGVDIANVDARLMNRLREMGIAHGLSSIHITSGYRSYDKQKELYDGWRAGKPGYNPANKPGKSWHEFGGAVDIRVWDSSLTNNDFKKYKLSRPAMPKEPWHIQISEIGSSPRASSKDEGTEYFESITKWG